MILPDRWEQLEPIVDQVLDADPRSRTALIEQLCGGNATRQREVERLVAECEAAMPLLDRPAVERFEDLIHTDPSGELPAVLDGRYHITRELGRGGMARIYLADDLRHGRTVAVKVIRPSLAKALGADRFLREIAIIARLRHPNIMPMYDSGDANGVLYFVMPYEDGSSLRTRLDSGVAMSNEDITSILRDVARALAYAHDQGIVHRDIKPDNVMLSGGAAVVSDFGIAKALIASQDPARGMPLTLPGQGVGTPAYMSPEQAAGDPAIDHRSDIYSFGCLAYELFAGRPPFVEQWSHELLAAHATVRPQPLAELCPRVSVSAARMIEQCLEKDRAQRPQTAQELIAALS